MSLRDVIADDAVSVFGNTSDFAESVTYYPHRFYGEAARAARTINAIVMREQISAVSQDGGDTVLAVWQVHVANDSTYGISSEELDLGGDQIELPPRDGEAAAKKTVTQLLIQDHGMLVLECR